MAAPQLLAVVPIGASRFRAVFDSPMHAAPDATDPLSPAVWSAGTQRGVEVVSTDHTEFTVTLNGPVTLAEPISVGVTASVESATGEPIDPTHRSVTVIFTEPDLALTNVVYPTAHSAVLTFNVDITSATLDQPNLQVLSQTVDTTTLTVTFRDIGTAGRVYPMRSIVRSANQSLVTSIGVIGQGARPYIADAIAASPSSLVLTLSEPMQGLTGVGALTLSQGALGASLTQADATLVFADTALVPSSTTSVSFGRATRQVDTGISFTGQASSSSGAGTESFSGSTTTLNKTSGALYELVFQGGVDQSTQSGRELNTTLQTTVTPDTVAFPVMAITFLSTMTSIVFESQPDGTTEAYFKNGPQGVEGSRSFPFSLSSPTAISIVDATSAGGYISLSIAGQVVCGAAASALQGFRNNSYSATAIAVVLGDPNDSTRVFSASFSTGLTTEAFWSASSMLGLQSNDLFRFDSVGFAVPAADAPLTPGFDQTGHAAFGVGASYHAGADAIFVVIGLNAAVASFTGSVSLLSGTGAVLDVAIVSSLYRILGSNEVVVSFVHPKFWSGIRVGVVITVNNTDYSVIAPVQATGLDTTSLLVRQPASWWYPRLSEQQSLVTTGFGPSASLLTPP